MELFNPKLDLAMNFDALTLSSQAKFKELREWKFLSRLKNQIKNYFNSSCKYWNIIIPNFFSILVYSWFQTLLPVKSFWQFWGVQSLKRTENLNWEFLYPLNIQHFL